MKVERPFRHCYSAATATAAALVLAGPALAANPTHCPVRGRAR